MPKPRVPPLALAKTKVLPESGQEASAKEEITSPFGRPSVQDEAQRKSGFKRASFCTPTDQPALSAQQALQARLGRRGSELVSVCFGCFCSRTQKFDCHCRLGWGNVAASW